jgi:CelD/BcsL family acetyltransferase involved in cellulose biosynthesis
VTRAPAGEVQPLGDWRAFLRLRRPWMALAAEDPDGALLGHDWTAQSWKCCDELQAGERPLILVWRDGGTLQAVLALRHNRRTRRLCFLEEARSPRLDLLAAPGLKEEAWAAMAAYLARRRDWDRLDLCFLREPGAVAARAAFAARRLAARVRGRVIQRWIDLGRPWEEVETGFGPYLRANLTRRLKRLRARGQVVLETWSRPAGLAAPLAACMRLERAGWKGRQGTAMLDRRNLERLFRQLAYRLASRGHLRLYCLRAGAELAAFEYCLADPVSRRLYSLKIGYDERLRTASPGTALRWLLLQAARSEFTRYEFLGHDAPWKAEWTAKTTELQHLRIFNRTLRGQGWRWRGAAYRKWQMLGWSRDRSRLGQ